MEFLKERLAEGYNLIVVRRKEPGYYYCSKEKFVEESGTFESYDKFEFEEGFEWPYILNVIYRIQDLL